MINYLYRKVLYLKDNIAIKKLMQNFSIHKSFSVIYIALFILIISFFYQIKADTSNPKSQLQQGLPPQKSITQYMLDIWQLNEREPEKGLPQISANTITQTHDGYLWVGTDEGLARFDGVKFKVFNKSNTKELKGNEISALFEDSQKILWVGTEDGGLSAYKNGSFYLWDEKNSFNAKSVTAIAETNLGNIIVATTDQGIYIINNCNIVEHYSKANGLPSDNITAVSLDTFGSGFWASTNDSGIFYYKDGSVIKKYTQQDGLLEDRIATILQDAKKGELWIGTHQSGLQLFKQGKFTSYINLSYSDSKDKNSADSSSDINSSRISNSSISNNSIRTLYKDNYGSLWIGTYGGGLNRLIGDKFENLSLSSGLSNEFIVSLFQDREGSLWIGTYRGGLNRLKNGKITLMTTMQGLSSDFISTIYQSKDNSIWLALDKMVNRINDGNVTVYSKETHNLVDEVATSFVEDDSGNIWIGTSSAGIHILNQNDKFYKRITKDDGLSSNAISHITKTKDGTILIATRDGGLNTYKNGKITIFDKTNGLLDNKVFSIFEDKYNGIWMSIYRTGINYLYNDTIRSFEEKDGLSSNMIFSIYEDKEGTIWLSTYGGGINRFKDGKFTSYKTKDGMFSDVALGILEDDHGYLWMSCNLGIYRVKKQQLNDFADGKYNGKIQSEVFGTDDGMKSRECSGGTPSAYKTSDGKLFFATIKGVAIIDPNNLYKNQVPPPVVVEDVIVDDKYYSTNEKIIFEPGKKRFEFHYTALSLVNPNKVRFQYMLEGYDQDWKLAKEHSERSISYTNLSPGNYNFRVRACNNDGLWNEVGASTSFVLQPFFYQTKTFYALCVLFIGFLGGSVQYLRILQLKLRERELSRLVEERTKTLAEANRQKSELLEQVKEQAAELERQTREDALTGLYNRRYLDVRLAEEFERAKRYKRIFTAVVSDIDHFKKVNDTFSHQMGDEVIKAVAKVFKSNSRNVDFVARYGGEEFVILFPELTIESSLIACERMRKAVEQYNWASLHPDLKVTISMGMSDDTSLESYQQMVSAADAKLYEAKRNGRNQVRY